MSVAGRFSPEPADMDLWGPNGSNDHYMSRSPDVQRRTKVSGKCKV